MGATERGPGRRRGRFQWGRVKGRLRDGCLLLPGGSGRSPSASGLRHQAGASLRTRGGPPAVTRRRGEKRGAGRGLGVQIPAREGPTRRRPNRGRVGAPAGGGARSRAGRSTAGRVRRAGPRPAGSGRFRLRSGRLGPAQGGRLRRGRGRRAVLRARCGNLRGSAFGPAEQGPDRLQRELPSSWQAVMAMPRVIPAPTEEGRAAVPSSGNTQPV